jgi:hypothetical protein
MSAGSVYSKVIRSGSGTRRDRTLQAAKCITANAQISMWRSRQAAKDAGDKVGAISSGLRRLLLQQPPSPLRFVSSTADARKTYGEQIVAMASGKPAPLTAKLNVQSQRDAGDPDRITLAQATVEDVKQKMKAQEQKKSQAQ